MKTLLVVALACSLAPEAHALDPYMWGVGPKLGTMVIPGSYPVLFRDAVEDPTTTDPLVHRVKNDMSVGADGVYYINGRSRARTLAGMAFGLGEPYFDVHMMFGYQYVMVTGAMDILGGGAAGFGYASFKNDDNRSVRLKMPYYPIRADLAALIRDDAAGYQLGLYGQMNLPGKQSFIDAAGLETTEGLWKPYLTSGIEFTFYLGDMLPPRRKK